MNRFFLLETFLTLIVFSSSTTNATEISQVSKESNTMHSQSIATATEDVNSSDKKLMATAYHLYNVKLIDSFRGEIDARPPRLEKPLNVLPYTEMKPSCRTP